MPFAPAVWQCYSALILDSATASEQRGWTGPGPSLVEWVLNSKWRETIPTSSPAQPPLSAADLATPNQHKQAANRQVYDVSAKNLGFDVTSLDLSSGELRLIEVKGIGAAAGTILLTPNERRVAEGRRDCYWLYVVTNCDTTPGCKSRSATRRGSTGPR